MKRCSIPQERVLGTSARFGRTGPFCGQSRAQVSAQSQEPRIPSQVPLSTKCRCMSVSRRREPVCFPCQPRCPPALQSSVTRQRTKKKPRPSNPRRPGSEVFVIDRNLQTRAAAGACGGGVPGLATYSADITRGRPHPAAALGFGRPFRACSCSSWLATHPPTCTVEA